MGEGALTAVGAPDNARPPAADKAASAAGERTCRGVRRSATAVRLSATACMHHSRASSAPLASTKLSAYARPSPQHAWATHECATSRGGRAARDACD